MFFNLISIEEGNVSKFLYFSGLLVLLIISFISAVKADEPPWQFRFKEDNISVYTRKLASELMEFKSDVIVAVPIDRVIAFYEKEKKTPQWYYQCTYMELLKDEGPLNKIFYFVMRPPWPVSQRDAVFRRIKSVDPSTGIVTYYLTALPEAFPRQKGKVRVPYLELVWRFTPLKGTRTEVYFQQHGDAGGYIPAFIVNAMLIDTPLNTLKSFRELIEKEVGPQIVQAEVESEAVKIEEKFHVKVSGQRIVQLIIILFIFLAACIWFRKYSQQ